MSELTAESHICQQCGDGVTGAVRTPTYLSAAGREARFTELPRHDLEKVDLDDQVEAYLAELPEELEDFAGV